MSMTLSTWCSPSMPSCGAGGALAPCRRLRQRAQQGVDHQRRFARARHAGHAGEHAERERHRQVAQVVPARAPQRQAAVAPTAAAAAGTSMRLRPDRYAPVSDCELRLDVLGLARGDDAPAVHAGLAAPCRSRGRRRGSCPRRARRPARCCRDRAGASASAAGARCRAGAGRSTARRGCRARRPASCRSGSPAGCAAPRRPTASPPCGRATGSRAPTLIRNDSRSPDLAQDAPGDLLLARRQRQPGQEVVRLADGQRRHLGDALVADRARSAPPCAGACPWHSSQTVCDM